MLSARAISAIAGFAAALEINFSTIIDVSIVPRTEAQTRGDSTGSSTNTPSRSMGRPSKAAQACIAQFDPERPVRANDCYTWAAFNQAMVAGRQQPVIVANNVALDDTVEGAYYTYNGSIGYGAELNAPLGTTPTLVTISTVYTNMRLNTEINSSSTTPRWAQFTYNPEEAKRACDRIQTQKELPCTPYNDVLSNAGRLNSRVMMMAQTLHSPSANNQWQTGQKIVLIRNMTEGIGTIRSVDSNGASITLAILNQPNFTQFASQY